MKSQKRERERELVEMVLVVKLQFVLFVDHQRFHERHHRLQKVLLEAIVLLPEIA
jgi:hypothetical protein